MPAEKRLCGFFFVFERYCRTPVLGLGLRVDYAFSWDNKNNNNKKIPHLNFSKGTVVGDKE